MVNYDSRRLHSKRSQLNSCKFFVPLLCLHTIPAARRWTASNGGMLSFCVGLILELCISSLIRELPCLLSLASSCLFAAVFFTCVKVYNYDLQLVGMLRDELSVDGQLRDIRLDR